MLLFRRVKAYPDGNVHFFYEDKVITYDKEGLPTIRIEPKKDTYGVFDGPNDLSNRGHQFSSDELYNYIPSFD